jgi:outer membrane biogenesis lipoprotein LolB
MIARIAASILVLLLGACATAPRQALPELASVPSSFEMTGRISIRQGDRSDIAKLRWTRTPGSDVWVISSPLGNDVARIESTPQGATLYQGGGTVEAPDFPALTERILGVGLDPDLLAAWLHGNAPVGARADWKFSIDETQKAGSVDLARRITATRGDTVVRLVVDGYQALAQ